MNSKQKGNTFERLVCSKLSTWLTDGEYTKACWRSDTSGAAATVLARKGREQAYVSKNAGDIRQILDRGVCKKLDAYFDQFTVECKHYKNISLYPPLNKTEKGFFEACKKQAQLTGKSPVLIMRQNNRQILYFQEGENPLSDIRSLITLRLDDLNLIMTGYLFDDVLNSTPPKPKKIEL